MLRLLIFLSLLAAGYIGFRAYQAKEATPASSSLPTINISHAPLLNNVSDVLGSSISSVVGTGRELLNTATAGKSDPLINQALKNIQNEIKDLPQEAVDKVKYEFCKDVVTEYENR